MTGFARRPESITTIRDYGFRARGLRPRPGMTTALSILKEPVRWARQSQVIAQRDAFVVAAEQPTALKLGNDAVDKVVEAAGQIREHHSEAVRAFARQPLLHLIGDRCRRADHGKAGIAAKPLRQFAHSQVLALGESDRALASALRGVALGDILRQRRVRIELRGVVAERNR